MPSCDEASATAVLQQLFCTREGSVHSPLLFGEPTHSCAGLPDEQAGCSLPVLAFVWVPVLPPTPPPPATPLPASPSTKTRPPHPAAPSAPSAPLEARTRAMRIL